MILQKTKKRGLLDGRPLFFCLQIDIYLLTLSLKALPALNAGTVAAAI